MFHIRIKRPLPLRLAMYPCMPKVAPPHPPTIASPTDLKICFCPEIEVDPSGSSASISKTSPPPGSIIEKFKMRAKTFLFRTFRKNAFPWLYKSISYNPIKCATMISHVVLSYFCYPRRPWFLNVNIN